MKKIIYIFMTLFFIFNTTACSSQSKEFKEKVDDFVDMYREIEYEDNALSKDIKMHLIVGQLRQVSKIYQDIENKEDLDKYLDKNISKEMFDMVYEYSIETYPGDENDIEESMKVFL